MTKFSRRRFLSASLGSGAIAAFAAFGLSRSSLTKVVRTGHALGSAISLTVLASNEPTAHTAIDAALAEIDAVEDALSLYRADSDLCRLNRQGVLRDPDPRLVEVLRHACQLSAATNGAFDVTVQPLWDVYDQARRAQQLPAAAAIAAAQACVDWRKIEITDHEVRLRDPRLRLTLNGIAQGYAADRAGLVLRQHGIAHALLDTGELAAHGRQAALPWRVGIQHPRVTDAFVALAELDNRALATSGDYATTFSADMRHNHVLDPATGQSPGELASVSIAASTAMEADALSTACFVLGIDKSLAFLRSRPQCDALFITKDERMVSTPGFPHVGEEVAHA